jgi:gamma-glutamylcyclotransferase (GGCT)/AIG2-like uncharacterized protein YtfP
VRYFAYCTLLDREEMGKFCPGAVAGDTGTISGWRVGFAAYDRANNRGGCQLIAEPGHEVYGILYELSDAEMTELDRISGVPDGFYQRIDVTVTTSDHQQIPAITYIIPNPEGSFQPSATYTRPIKVGARAVGLPDDYVAELEQAISAASDGQH